LGNAEIHTNDTKEPVRVPGVHFAVEIDDWDEMIAHLDNLGVFYSKVQRQAPGAEKSWGIRDYTGNYYSYIRDPDGNIIEMVHHPLGIEDSTGKKVDLRHDGDSLTWTKRPEFDPAG
jgi:lactoylglutathione lyase